MEAGSGAAEDDDGDGDSDDGADEKEDGAVETEDGAGVDRGRFSAAEREREGATWRTIESDKSEESVKRISGRKHSR